MGDRLEGRQRAIEGIVESTTTSLDSDWHYYSPLRPSHRWYLIYSAPAVAAAADDIGL